MNTREAKAEIILSDALISKSPADNFDNIINYISEINKLGDKGDSIWTIFLDKMLEKMQKGGLSSEDNKDNKALYDFIKRFAALAKACGKEHVFETHASWQSTYRNQFVLEAATRNNLDVLQMFDSEGKIFKISGSVQEYTKSFHNNFFSNKENSRSGSMSSPQLSSGAASSIHSTRPKKTLT